MKFIEFTLNYKKFYMKGRSTCNALKQIRKDIADANEIDYQIEECHYEGDCAGTCPKCESEMRYIESELLKRQRLGKAVVLAGLATSLTVFTGASCNNTRQIQGDVQRVDTTQCDLQPKDTIDEEVYMLEGDVAAPMPEEKE